MNWREFQRMQRVVQLNDRFVSYVDEGEGDAVVLLHGIPTWGYLWSGMLDHLAQTHRVLIPDLMGYGFSDRRDAFNRSVARQAEWMHAWMDALSLEKASVVAHDIGGGVALRLATLFPARVERLCVMNTVCYDSWPIEMMLQLGHPEMRHKMSAAAVLTMLRQGLKQGFAHVPDDEFLDGLLAPYRTEVGKLSMIRNAASLNTNDTVEVTSRLPALDIPTLVIWGEEDPFQLVTFAERLVGDIPTAQLVCFPEARHFVMIDKPDQTAQQVSVFLSERIGTRRHGSTSSRQAEKTTTGQS